MELRLAVRLCGTGSLKALPCSNTLPASCRLLRQRQKHLLVIPHQQCSQSRFIQSGMRCRSSLGTQLAALCQNTPCQGGADGEWLCKVNIGCSWIQSAGSAASKHSKDKFFLCNIVSLTVSVHQLSCVFF